MYIRGVSIFDIKCFAHVEWELEDQVDAGWHVILGDNGSGKSTFIRSLALALIGHSDAAALRLNWEDWLRHGSSTGLIRLDLRRDKNQDKVAGQGRATTRYLLPVGVKFTRDDDGVAISSIRAQYPKSQPKLDPQRYLRGDKGGWFSASFGPFRRFTGGDKEYAKLFYSFPKVARHLTAFGENIALTESLEWLSLLNYRAIEDKPEGLLLPLIKEFVNQPGFLPFGARLEGISSEGVVFVDASGGPVKIEEMSDGYRSILSLTFELVRQLVESFGPENLFKKTADNQLVVNASGVVAIDEVDVHLHPKWQREIGKWLLRLFPRIQFIVTTHSPLICQAATKGSIFQLPSPGSNGPGRFVSGQELERLLFGDSVEALGTDAFGLPTTRSQEGMNLLERLAELNNKEIQSGLSETEREERDLLRRALPIESGALNLHQ
jgi:hypothetical protein